MTRWPVRVPAALLAALLVLSGCTATGDDAPRYGSDVRGAGTGRFVFPGEGPLADRPVPVWYAAPQGDVRAAEVLVVIPGVDRNAEEYRDDWIETSRRHNVLVLVPEFSEKDWPGSTSYNLGNLVDEEGESRDPDEWTFSLVESLFSHVARDVGLSAQEYALFGHSAGAQFVHRFVEFMPDHRVRVAVAANAGWYTMPDDDVDFPYGLGEVPLSEDELEPALRTPLVVLLGADDVDPSAEHLRRTDDADRQGDNRLERGLNFYREAREVAAEQNAEFRWRLSVVPGVGHSRSQMARAAEPLLVSRLSR